ncbi:hypothetical protein ABK040_002459 [Willaertia magna]
MFQQLPNNNYLSNNVINNVNNNNNSNTNNANDSHHHQFSATPMNRLSNTIHNNNSSINYNNNNNNNSGFGFYSHYYNSSALSSNRSSSTSSLSSNSSHSPYSPINNNNNYNNNNNNSYIVHGNNNNGHQTMMNDSQLVVHNNNNHQHLMLTANYLNQHLNNQSTTGSNHTNYSVNVLSYDNPLLQQYFESPPSSNTDHPSLNHQPNDNGYLNNNTMTLIQQLNGIPQQESQQTLQNQTQNGKQNENHSINYQQQLKEFRFGNTDNTNNTLQNDDPSNWNLSDFELYQIIGTGSFGCVRIVKRKNNFYAMKIMKKYEIIKKKQVEHIKSEKIVLEKIINHPFIIKLFKTFQDDNYLYMVMEFANGGELFSHLRRCGQFPNDVAKFYAAEIIIAVEYLHSKNIIYRDLKPENILLDKEGHLKITDFGFAKVLSEKENRAWTFCGTPEYMAPEIINQKGHGKGVDWWALGILIYEMLVGYPPFHDEERNENPMKLCTKILTDKVQYPNFLDPAAIDLIEQLLNKDKVKRLGCLKGGAKDIKNHVWFRGVDWSVLEVRGYPAPIPIKVSSEGDSRYFESYQEARDGGIHHRGKEVQPLSPQQQVLFEDF